MRIAIVPHYNVNLFPALHFLSAALIQRGADVQLLSREEPTDTGIDEPRVVWSELKRIEGIAANIPGIRSNIHGIVQALLNFRPNWIIAQQEYMVAGIIYNMLMPSRRARLAGYFCDHYNVGLGMSLLSHMADRLDVYVDVCDLRLQWRRAEWPAMRAAQFVVRQAPPRIEFASPGHAGRSRIVFTGSRNVLRMDRKRLSRFFDRLCWNGISVDWYLSGSAGINSGEDLRAEASALSRHPLYSVKEPVPKSRLRTMLREYDVGLFWAPLAEQTDNRSFFLSAASNKIGEYIAGGLVVAHTGNPGLAYLPQDVCVVFDPTDPVAGADQLAASLTNRRTVERKRTAALSYHLSEMNFEAQAAPLCRHLLGGD